jgi:5'-nucleotidase
MTSARPHVLLTNDDGIHAPGLRALAAALREIADLTIVAPSQENSGMGHAITVFRDLHFAPVHEDGHLWGWGLNGTPADCVKVAIHMLGRDRPFDAVISGINRGQNAGINVLYSGTVAAAREAAIYGLPAMAVSLLYKVEDYMPYETAARVAADVLKLMQQHPLPRGVMLNVNVPPVEYDALQGWAVTRMGDSGYSDFFELQGASASAAPAANAPGIGARPDSMPAAALVPAAALEVDRPASGEAPTNGLTRAIATPNHNPTGPTTFRNIGCGWNPSGEGCPDIDDQALYQDQVAITPLHFDLTAYSFLEELQGWFK